MEIDQIALGTKMLLQKPDKKEVNKRYKLFLDLKMFADSKIKITEY